MAILSKIRDRSVALIAVIGLALFAFVLDPSTLSDFFNSTKVNEVGEVDGESISRQQYAEAVELYRTRAGGMLSEMQIASRVWDDLVKEKIYTNQLEKAGITIGENDVWQRMITLPAVTGSPVFQNEAGMFEEGKFKQFLANAQANDPGTYKAWTTYMGQIKYAMLSETYNNLINAGMGASLKEGEYKHIEDNKSFDANYVYVPYSSIPDSLITVSEADIDKYVKSHSKQFKADASRDISYVKFDIVATTSDKEALKKEVASVLEDKKVFNKVTKQEETLLGLKNTTDYVEFFNENASDIPYNENYVLATQLAPSQVNAIVAGKVNDIFGPYEDANMFKISKLLDVKKMPDSVKSSHIIIPFIGAPRAQGATKTEEQAKKSADSILRLVRRSKSKFAQIADEINIDGTKGKGGDIGWTTFNIGFSNRFDRAFADYIFNNKKGSVGVVKSNFGFHVIRVDESKNMKDVVKLATYGKRIEPSTDTETAVFQDAETFALEVSKDKSKFNDVAKSKNLSVRPAVGIKMYDDLVPGVGNSREIVNWSFDKETKIGDYKRFDVNGGYVVVVLTAKEAKGLMSAKKASPRVKHLIVREKKAALLADKFAGANLNDIASSNNVQVSQMSGINLKAPSITGVGLEPKVVGAMFNAETGKVYKNIVGDKGVFAFVVNKVEDPTALPNYNAERNRLAQTRKNRSFRAFDALKEISNVKDERAMFYGINQ